MLSEGTPSESVLMLNKKEYKAAGQLMAMSIVQEDFQPQLLDEWCYRVISSNFSLGPTDVEPTTEFLSSKTIDKVFSIIIFSYLHFFFLFVFLL